jgi:hypothetical protein
MIGDFFYGGPAGLRGYREVDRLLVIANDLDVPLVLPPANSPLALTEGGPVGIYETSVSSVQQLQQLLRDGTPLPPANLVGTILDNRTMTTALTITEIQSLLASTPGVAYDIVPLIPPPASYQNAVDTEFQLRNAAGGNTVYDNAASGALLQGGADTLVGGEDFDAFYYYSYVLAIEARSPSAGLGGVGRLKVAEGNSPLPRDRVFFRYGYFNGVPLSAAGVDVNRFVPGFEKTCLDGRVSVEMRFPFASSVDSAMTFDGSGITNSDAVEFGNLATYIKLLLYSTNCLSLSGGLGVTSPTARDLDVRLADGTRLVRINNQSAHLQPFFGALFTPNDRFFAQGFLQVDIDANGNAVAVNSGNGLQRAGRLNDAAYLFADVGLGYWLYQSQCATLRGVAPTIELHYNQSLGSADYVTAGPLRVGNFAENVDALNLTVGSTFVLGDTTNLTVGYITSLSGGADQQTNGGLRVLLDCNPWACL